MQSSVYNRDFSCPHPHLPRLWENKTNLIQNQLHHPLMSGAGVCSDSWDHPGLMCLWASPSDAHNYGCCLYFSHLNQAQNSAPSGLFTSLHTHPAFCELYLRRGVGGVGSDEGRGEGLSSHRAHSLTSHRSLSCSHPSAPPHVLSFPLHVLSFPLLSLL